MATMMASVVLERGTGTVPRSERPARFDREAMAQMDALYSFAFKLTKVREEAEDLVSDTMLRAFERWRQFQLGSNIRAWLFTILYHAFISRKRRIDAREVPMPETEDGFSRLEPVADENPEATFYDSFIDEDVVKAIGELPEEYRSALVMSDVHGLRYAEIARVLGVPEGTVKSRLFRGRRLLQGRLRAYAEEMGYIAAKR
ncbi:MAG: sigma-70 family RNA polymerase sigma factor [Gemmatimonadetes bacterium]|nr:sigma-70 family RNA polymerase sigma factor [Gemmatimonadota bacterium]